MFARGPARDLRPAHDILGFSVEGLSIMEEAPSLNAAGVVYTGGLEVRPRGRRRAVLVAAGTALGGLVISGVLGLWLVAAPIETQSGAWYWVQSHVAHSDAGDRFLSGIELRDRRLFESSVSRSCGETVNEPCFTWRYDDGGFHRHWGHYMYRNRNGDRVSIWNVNRVLDGYLGPEEAVQAWGFVLDKDGLVKAIL